MSVENYVIKETYIFLKKRFLQLKIVTIDHIWSIIMSVENYEKIRFRFIRSKLGLINKKII